MVDLNLDLTAPSISCSLLRSSLFCRSSCCRAFSFFWAVLRSVASSLLSCSAWGGGWRSPGGGRPEAPLPPLQHPAPPWPSFKAQPRGSPSRPHLSATPAPRRGPSAHRGGVLTVGRWGLRKRQEGDRQALLGEPRLLEGATTGGPAGQVLG